MTTALGNNTPVFSSTTLVSVGIHTRSKLQNADQGSTGPYRFSQSRTLPLQSDHCK